MRSLRRLVLNQTSQVLIDLAVFAFSWFAAYVVRFEGPPPGRYLSQMLVLAPYAVLARLALFRLFPVYTIVWRYVSIRDAFLLVKALVPPTVVLLAARYAAPDAAPLLRVPTSVIGSSAP